MKSVILLSGGLDSTTNFYQAAQESEVLLALNFNYGQRAFLKENQAAKFFCDELNVPLKTISLEWFKDFGKSSLVDTTQVVPTGKQVIIDNLARSLETAKSVWVPNRNGIFLNIAAGFAEALGASHIIPGFNAEEAATFPDNSGAFLEAMTKSLHFSTANHVKAHCFTTDLNKTQMLGRAIALKVPLEKLWPCYFAHDSWCGVCESCQRYARALKEHMALTR